MRTGEYPEDWDARRKEVLERDSYECQECGATDTTLQVHHLTPISEGGSHDTANLTTVCRSCHAAEHPTRVKLSTAVQQQRRLRMKYSSSTGTRVRELDPYGVAMHEGIQYVVGHDHYRGEIRTFRPKRIKWAELTDRSFSKPAGWDTEQYLIDDMGYQRGTRSRKSRPRKAQGQITVPDGLGEAVLLIGAFLGLTVASYAFVTAILRTTGLGGVVPQFLVSLGSFGVGVYGLLKLSS